MLIELVVCPVCSAQFIVDDPLWRSGIKLHCPECDTYFLPAGAPESLTAQQVCGSSVPVAIWTPELPGAESREN